LRRLSTSDDLEQFNLLLGKLKHTSVEIIWDEIKKDVSARMFAEFGCLYNNNPNHKEFVEFIECGSDIILEGLEKFENTITPQVNSAHSSLVIRPRP
jgi:hypothetical protein